MDNVFLTQLIYTRISHDLSGAAGAVYNGTELLCEDLSFASETAGLIQSSADNLMKRLRFFRQTFGLQNKEEPDTTLDYLSTFTMPFSISRPCQNNLERSLVMMFTDVFYKGAKFDLSPSAIYATGEVKKDCSFIYDILEKGFIEDKADTAPAVFAYFLVQQMHKRFMVITNPGSVQIQIQE